MGTLFVVLGKVLLVLVSLFGLAVVIGKRLQRIGRETTAPVSAQGDVLVRLDPRKILDQTQ